MTCQFEPDTPLYIELEQLFSASFRQLGIPFRMQPMPVQRSITDVDRGRADGNCLRIKELVERGPYPNIALVNTPLIAITFDVWVLSDGKGYPSFSDIVSGGGLIGFERGVWIVERKLSALVPEQQLVVVADVKSGVEMLAARRIDAFIHADMKIADAIEAAERRRSVTVRRAGTLMGAEMFAVVNQKHHLLAPKLAAAISASLDQVCGQDSTGQFPLLCEFYRTKHPLSLLP
ncbi:hypothetical protein QWY82_05245 [Simiduia curdlanivorans]|uniref:Transporter substrate-binding domain-containing protein n=1 Tax=Simiduia curdlanivorans TaxID=1492769 RepID=A0ABV8V3R4_9GAMM|nr:transporter substrate-binding domain-containing protein [Simiduia curdlanivorans]MDN3638215.1 hypothetical protein [Simiduia curdlanivorans]